MAEVYLEFDKKKMKNASVFEELISVFSSVLEISTYLSLML